MFLLQFQGLVALRVMRSICLMSFGLIVSGGGAFAQYGFTPISTSAIGNEWGNYYLGAATQPSSWNRIPGYYTTNNAYQPPRQLGVYMQNTPNGVIVGQITPGSVAERAGLKAGDLIVSVAGIQVGIVNGRVVDVMYVINTNLDYFGRVSALVFDGSTRVAKSLVFDFSTNTTAITAVNGQVALEGGFSAYRSGTIKVDLVNLTRPYLTASVRSVRCSSRRSISCVESP